MAQDKGRLSKKRTPPKGGAVAAKGRARQNQKRARRNPTDRVAILGKTVPVWGAKIPTPMPKAQPTKKARKPRPKQNMRNRYRSV